MPYRHCKDRQVSWAREQGLPLQGSEGSRGEEAYTLVLDANLFVPLSAESLREIESGEGNELRPEKPEWPAKMQAVHSSAALTTNVFEYWRQQRNRNPIARALDLSPLEIDFFVTL
jgi:hypothetical protein